ncbi:XRE family transcriptional regulator [Pseudomonas stutzeri]|nr:XRE family transcriptional regulator [Stutzerimonas stutzeri]MBK3851828.1 XRE family transcriptional regulator [Stutzerimonas stutzeri]
MKFTIDIARPATARQRLAQEDLANRDSCTHVSLLEQAATSPTLEKPDNLCQVLDIRLSLPGHYLSVCSRKLRGRESLLQRVGDELVRLLTESVPEVSV